MLLFAGDRLIGQELAFFRVPRLSAPRQMYNCIEEERTMGIEPSQFHTPLFDRNPSFAATNHVIELTRPLAALGLRYFTFDRHYSDGGRISLTNHAQWIKHYWQSGLFKRAIFEQTPTHFSSGYVLWDWLNREPVYSEAALHGINRGITLTKNHESHCDFFHFGATNDISITNEFIISNLTRLHRFAALFEHKMQAIIKNAEKEKIFPRIASDNLYTQYSSNDVAHNVFEESLLGLLGKRDASRIYLGEEFDHCHLTRGEAMLIRELSSGVSCSDISKRLNISDDAVNKHIKSIKAKLGVKTLCQLGFIAGQLCANTIPLLTNKKEN